MNLQEKKRVLGYVNSPETREKMRLAKLGKRGSDTNHYGKPHSDVARAKISEKLKGKPSTFTGKKHSEESRYKMSQSLMGKLADEKNTNWRGNEVGYYALHAWIRRKLGKPETCSYCKNTGLTGKKIHWANKSHQYLRDFDDWIRLCAKCHKAYDAGKLTLTQIGG